MFYPNPSQRQKTPTHGGSSEAGFSTLSLRSQRTEVTEQTDFTVSAAQAPFLPCDTHSRDELRDRRPGPQRGLESQGPSWSLTTPLIGPESQLPGPRLLHVLTYRRCCAESPTPPCSLAAPQLRQLLDDAPLESVPLTALSSSALGTRSRAGDGRGTWTHSGLCPVLRQQEHGPGPGSGARVSSALTYPHNVSAVAGTPGLCMGGDRGSLSRPQICLLFPGFLSAALGVSARCEGERDYFTLLQAPEPTWFEWLEPQ